MGGLGSRLHRSEDGSWIAYAQWPHKDAWEAAGKSSPTVSTARDLMNAAITSHEVLHRMEVVNDLLVGTA